MQRTRRRALARFIFCLVASITFIGPTLGDQVLEIEAKLPNILVILADDLGYTDPGFMGSEIATPNIDALASRGLVFTNFYAAPVCTPARAQLLTGIDNNLAGTGRSVNYRLNPEIKTIAEVLGEHTGYESIIVGKWDLGWGQGLLPVDRGFDRSFSILPGAIDHFRALHRLAEKKAEGPLVEDGETVTVSSDFYTTTAFTDKLIEYIGQRSADKPPFFAFASYMAPHWPLAAPEAEIRKYENLYLEGYSAIRDARIDRLRNLFPEHSWPGTTTDDQLGVWDELDESQQKAEARRMGAYAAMVTILDREIGRLINHLDSAGLLEQTIVLFLSDNGADALTEEKVPFLLPGVERGEADNSLNNIGRPGSYSTVGPNWARVSSGPLNGTKETSLEGGIAVPAVLVMPGQNLGRRSTEALVGVRDIAATIYELANVNSNIRRQLSPPLEGRSLLPLVSGAQRIRSENEPLIIYNVERYTGEAVAALRKGNWKLVRNGTEAEWMIFDVKNDRGETRNLLNEKPAILADLWSDWIAYAKRIGIEPGQIPGKR